MIKGPLNPSHATQKKKKSTLPLLLFRFDNNRKNPFVRKLPFFPFFFCYNSVKRCCLKNWTMQLCLLSSFETFFHVSHRQQGKAFVFLVIWSGLFSSVHLEVSVSSFFLSLFESVNFLSTSFLHSNRKPHTFSSFFFSWRRKNLFF